MRCRTVRRLLFDYIDGILDKETSETVRSHIKSCDGCARELETYRTYREKISPLQDVHAPEGFLAGVKKKIRIAENRNAPKGRIRLFPPGFKLPLELAGALAVVLIAVVIFRHIEPERKRPALPVIVEKTADQKLHPPVEEETAETLEEDEAPRAEATDNTSALSDIRTARRQGTPPVPNEAAPSAGAPVEQEPGLEDLMKAPEAGGEIDMEALQATPGAAGSEDRLLVSSPSGKALAVELTLSVPRPSEEMREKAAAKKELRAKEAVTSEADETVSELQKEDVPVGAIEKEIRSLSEELGGMVISIEYGTGRDRLRGISVQIPAGRYDDLLEGLSILGVLETPMPEISPDDKPSLLVRITIAE